MNSKTLRALAIGLLLGAGLMSASLVTSEPAFAQLKITNKALGKPLQEALDAAKAGNYKLALQKAQEADAVPGKSPAETAAVHQYMANFALQLGDDKTALAMLEKMIAANEGNKADNLKSAAGEAMKLHDNAKAQQYLAQIPGGGSALLMAQLQSTAKNYKECIRLARPLLGEGQPSKDVLGTLAYCYSESGDQAGRRDMLEQLTLYYPSPQYWHDLIRLAKNEKGQNDAQKLDLERIRLLVGDIKSPDEYSEMAQMALIVGNPADAKSVLDKATAAKALSGEKGQRLVAMTDQRVAQDQQQLLPALEKQAQSDPTGNANVKLGLSYLSYGKTKEAEDAVRTGIKKGQLTDADAAKVALGRVLLAENKKSDAASQFSSVPKTSKWATIAHLWSIYARH